MEPANRAIVTGGGRRGRSEKHVPTLRIYARTMAFSLLAAWALCPPVHALTVTYDFTGDALGLATGNLGSSLVLTEDGVTVRVSAAKDVDDGVAGEIHRNAVDGLGVIGDPDLNRVGGSADSSVLESLVFDFSPRRVTALDGVVFERGPDSGALDYFVDGNFIRNIAWTNLGTNGRFAHDLLDMRGRTFEFRATGTGNFRVSQLTFVISEPVTLFLLGFGLAAFGLVTWRRAAGSRRGGDLPGDLNGSLTLIIPSIGKGRSSASWKRFLYGLRG